MPLDQETISRLQAKQVAAPAKYPRAQQRGPFRFHENPRVCEYKTAFQLVPGFGICKSPTHVTVEGKPACLAHATILLNELVLEMQDVMERRLSATAT